jgi:hypothetical protein
LRNFRIETETMNNSTNCWLTQLFYLTLQKFSRDFSWYPALPKNQNKKINFNINMTRSIKVGFLVSYDYELIVHSLPPVYEYADKIVLAVDKDEKTWSGNSFQIADSFWQWIKEFDSHHKIEIYKDSFYVERLSIIQCETRERNLLGKFMGSGGWHVQIDADEYFADFKVFVDFLHWLDKEKKHIDCVNQEWLVLYKRVSSGCLFVKGYGGGTALATTRPEYICARIIDRPKKILYPQKIIHDSWARSEQALWTKLNNWGHKNDFNTEGYFHFWKAIDEKNYRFVQNFGPIWPEIWKELDYIEAPDIPALLHEIKTKRSDLLQIDKQPPLIIRFLKLCIPPIFKELSGWYRNRKFLNTLRPNKYL